MNAYVRVQLPITLKCFLIRRSPPKVPSIEGGIPGFEVKVPSSEVGE